MDHPLHLAVGTEVDRQISAAVRIVRDKACGGSQHIPLFCSVHRKYGTQLCKVDLLLIRENQVRAIIEIEESGFNPTKICGKFLTSALATHFIHDSEPTSVVPYADKVLFIQVLDGSKSLKPGTSKRDQCELIEAHINRMLPLQGSTVSEYRLFFVNGVKDSKGLDEVSRTVAAFA